MADDVKPQDEIELSAGDKRLRIRGSDILGIATLLIVILLAYLFWEHRTDAKDATKELVGAIKEQTIAQKQTVQAQREMNCIIALPQERREAELTSGNSFCRRLLRE